MHRLTRISRAAGLLGLGLVLSACAGETQDALARNAAKSTVNRVLLERYPGLPVGPAIDCAIDNATAQEIYALAADSVTGPTASTVQITGTILQRPGTIQCLAREGLPAILQARI